MFAYPPGATPLDADETKGLIPSHIATQGELNEWEQANILKGQSWGMRFRGNVLTEDFLQKLHRQMFDETWTWAGTFRKSDKNIGCVWVKVPSEVRGLLADVAYQIEAQAYEPSELAVRFHHRLVSIHPFPNGNGRHARMMADILVLRLGGTRFTWGKQSLVDANETRKQYIDALRAADAHDPTALIAFARS